MTPTRRQLLATSSAAGGLALAMTTPVQASSVDQYEDYGYEIDYPEQWLQEYRPAFVSDYHTMQRSEALYAHRATSDDGEQWAVYWHRMTHQDGLSIGPLDTAIDAHQYDHEPVYVRVEDDEPVEVVYTFYHHFADVLDGDGLSDRLRARERDDPTHVQLRIVDPWHHYAPESDPDDAAVSFVNVEGDGEASHLATWERRGIFDATAAEALYDPASVADRGSWWDEGTRDYRVATLAMTLGQWIDIAGSQEALN